jgi:predicted nucleotidyltransferase
MMPTMEHIKELSVEIGREFHPDRVILFGSHARGAANADSDVDLLVIMPFEGKPIQKYAEIRMKLRPPFPLDLLVRTPAKVDERLAMDDDFMKEVLHEGIVLYEA